MPETIRFGRAICGTLAEAERREWWIANGRGAYAAGTIAGTLTRRYHGLLIAPVDPPLGRRLVFAKADATLLDGARSHPLFVNRWGSGQIAPQGHLDIESFHLDHSVPVWMFAVGGWRIEARIWMEPGEDTTWIGWFLHPSARDATALSLRVTLLANNRDHNGETWEDGFQPAVSAAGDTLRVADGTRFTLRLRVLGGRITPRRDWYRDFDLPIEAERGLGARDAHLCVGEATLALRPGEWRGVVANLAGGPGGEPGGEPAGDLAAALERRLAHDRKVLAAAHRPADPPWVKRLALAADAFLFDRPLPEEPDGQSVIAGYPWFGDWGRDTMISLPGLTIATGRPDLALRILRTFSRFISQGMLPNVFPGAGDTAEYNTADASLWFFEAWRAYVAATGDRTALRTVFPVLADMVGWHKRGTRHGIVMDTADGLLRAGEAGVQLTWMDAKVGDWVVTPRIGKPVEINALWYNALCIMADFAAILGEADNFSADAAAARAGFARFVRTDGQGLYDVIDGPDGMDARVRPNQIFAVSLPHSPLAAADQLPVVETCRRHLLTSYGLRSLAPGSADYHARYTGDVRRRDGGYHEGAVWAWLLGHFVLASYRVAGDAKAALALLAPIRDTLFDQGLGTVGEIFDGDPPHDPRGAPAQAWSVACTLQAWHALRATRSEGP
ncbi:MAG: amylo-alpha-1,6-glucosidase [Acetobacteraceae bacterium]